MNKYEVFIWYFYWFCNDKIIKDTRKFCVNEFISKLPQGLDTQIGENGVKLSGGQRQRVAIARAFIKDAPFLLLDEATSALDSESEKKIQNSLNRLLKGKTSLVIAHRLSTINDSDNIILLDKGKIIGTGNHQSLINKSKLYKRLYELQFLKKNYAKKIN